MAYVKIRPIKSDYHLKQSIDYIRNPLKTDNGLLVSSYMCIAEYAHEDFRETLKHSLRKSGNNFAHHITQSFAPEDNVTSEQAMKMGQELVEKIYPNHQYVIATHIDRKHIHNHIILCAVNYTTHKKLKSNKETLQKIRNISDELCQRYGISIIEPSSMATSENKPVNIYAMKSIKASIRARIRCDIDCYLKKTSNYEEFIKLLEKYYYIRQRKYFALKNKNCGKRFIRLKSLGNEYSEQMLRLKFEDFEKYNRIRSDIKELRRFTSLKTTDELINRYNAAKNINLSIDVLNFMHKANIHNYDNLLEKINEQRTKISGLEELKKKAADSLSKETNKQRIIRRNIILQTLETDIIEETTKLKKYVSIRQSFDNATIHKGHNTTNEKNADVKENAISHSTKHHDYYNR